MLGGLGQLGRCGLCFLRLRSHLAGGRVDPGHQVAQRFHGKVHRVGDGAGHIFRNRGFDGQVTIGQRTHFIQQAQDGLLVALVDLCGVERTPSLDDIQVQTDEEQHQQRCRRQADPGGQRRPQLTLAQAGIFNGKRARLIGQLGRVKNDFIGCFAYLEQIGGPAENGVDVNLDLFEHRLNLGQRGQHLLVAHRRNVQRVVAQDQALQHLVEQLRFAAEGIGGRDRATAATENFADSTQHAVGQYQLATGEIDLRGWRAGADHGLNRLVRQRLQARHVGRECDRRISQVEHQLRAAQDASGLAVNALPDLFQCRKAVVDLTRRRRQCGGRIAVAQLVDRVGNDVASFGELVEGVEVADRGFTGSLRQLLSTHLDFRGQRQILGFLRVALVEQEEVQRNRADQTNQNQEQQNLRR